MNLVEALAETLAANPTRRVMHSPRIAGLPVARPPERVQRSSSRYAFTTIGGRGRLGDRSFIRLLNWPPGTSLKPTVLDDQIIALSRSPASRLSRSSATSGYQQRSGTAVSYVRGDGLLLTTSAARDLLVVCTASAPDQPAPTSMPSIREYVERVAKAVPAGTLRIYETYWNRIVDEWGDRPLDEPTPLDIKQLAERTKADAGSVPRAPAARPR